jgi:hypothetical protein
MTNRLRTLKDLKTQLENTVNTISEYISGRDFEEYCDSIYSTIAVLREIINKVKIEEDSPKEMGTTFRTSYNPSEMTETAKRQLRLHFPHSIIEDTVRFKVSTCVRIIKEDGNNLLSITLTTKNLIRKLHELNYDYLEF